MKILDNKKILSKVFTLILFCILFENSAKAQQQEVLFTIPQYPTSEDTVYLVSRINIGSTDSIIVNINNFEINVFAYYRPNEHHGPPTGTLDTTKIGTLTEGNYFLYFISQRYNVTYWFVPSIRIIEFTVNDSNLILQEIKPDNLITVYPNPAKDKIEIKNNYNLFLQSIELFGINGRLIKTFCASSTALDISDITKGQYILNIHTDKGEFVEKIIIQ